MYQKFVPILIMVASFFIGCKNSTSVYATSKSTVFAEKIATRDVSINKANSYNDIFLDSGAVERFITTEKLNDTISAAMRSFYNARNFEYAWFASTGLIEQSFSFRSLCSSENDADLFNKSLESRLDRLRIEPDSSVDPKALATAKRWRKFESGAKATTQYRQGYGCQTFYSDPG